LRPLDPESFFALKQTIYSLSTTLGVHRVAAAVHRRQWHMCMGDSDGDIWTGAM
jgi:hypothetical protein